MDVAQPAGRRSVFPAKAPQPLAQPLGSDTHRQNASMLWTYCIVVFVTFLAAANFHFTPPLLYVVCITAIYLSGAPTHLLSPRNVLYAYHLLFYGIAVMGAERYQDFDFSNPAVNQSYLMLITSYIVSFLTLFHVENMNVARLRVVTFLSTQRNLPVSLTTFGLAAAAVSVTAGVLMVLATGGFAHWIANPGRAFLSREGGGVYYIVLLMSSSVAAACLGAEAFQGRNRALFAIYLVTLVLMTPLLGGKQRVFMTLIFLFMPWVFFARTYSRKAFYVFMAFLVCFALGTWFRNMHWLEAGDMLAYSLNYFSTLDNLVMSVRDFEPGWGQTTFLPFNKFLTPFGVGDNVVYYDMSAWLTSIYFPQFWDLRCTEQWPIETDLYLSFHYAFGLPLLAAYMAIVGLLANAAYRTRSLGFLLVSTYVTFMLPSHLRGGLIIWTEFYLVPFWCLCLWLLGSTLIHFPSRSFSRPSRLAFSGTKE